MSGAAGLERSGAAKSDALILFADEDIAAPMAWAFADADTGAILARGLSDETPPPAAAPERTALVLPGADAQVKRVELPARSYEQARAAAQLMFEGALLDATDTHYAFGEPAETTGARLAAAISRQRLEQWLERCRALGAEPHFVALDFTVWPTARGDIEIHQADTRAIVSAGAWGGFSIEPALAPALYERWHAQLPGRVSRVRLSGGAGVNWINIAQRDDTGIETRADVDAIAELARGVIQAPPFAPNLRQGPFAPHAKRAGGWRLWRFALLLLAAAYLLQLGNLLVAGMRDASAAEQTRAAAERELLEARPELGRVRNVRAQVNAIVNAYERADANAVLSVNAALVEIFSQQPLVHVDEVRHAGETRTVELELSASDQSALDAALTALSAAGLSPQAGPPREESGRFVADVSVEAP